MCIQIARVHKKERKTFMGLPVIVCRGWMGVPRGCVEKK